MHAWVVCANLVRGSNALCKENSPAETLWAIGGDKMLSEGIRGSVMDGEEGMYPWHKDDSKNPVE